jgi:hypothetical protein
MSRKYWIGIVLVFGVGLAGLFCLTAYQNPARAEAPQAENGMNSAAFQIPPPPYRTTTAILSDSPDPSRRGEEVVVQFRVSSLYGNPSGLVTLTTSPGSYTCSCTAWIRECRLTIPQKGDYVITARYEGVPGYYYSSSDTETHKVK